MFKAFRLLHVIIVSYCILFSVTAVTADALPIPSSEVILTISGNIANTNEGDTAQFDRNMLEQIGLVDITTTTPWFDGEVTFAGVLATDLLRLVGAQGETIRAIALNDYEVEIPLSDALDTGFIFAIKRNGEIMSVRDKGPIFVIYPFDSNSDLKNQTYYGRSAWQVTRLIIR